jgi:asparagine synthase (glutamine-hydrolysing)
MDEPFGSTSAYAEWCVFRTVGNTDVKVTLDGHGADELLGGYVAYGGVLLADLLRRGRILTFAKEGTALLRSGRHSVRELGLSTLDDLLSAEERAALRRRGGQTSPQPDWIDLRRLNVQPRDPYADTGGRSRGIRGLSLSQLTATSLPMQLHWNDRTSMAHSIESRAPFLDVRLVEATLALADAFKIQGGETKAVLRRALADVLPPEVAGRRDKMGFVTPEEIWVRNQRPERFLHAARAAIDRSGGILTQAARQRVDDILSGRRKYHASLWRMVSFGTWLDLFNVVIP